MGDFEDFNFEDIIDENFSIVAEEINLSDTEEKDENKSERIELRYKRVDIQQYCREKVIDRKKNII